MLQGDFFRVVMLVLPRTFSMYLLCLKSLEKHRIQLIRFKYDMYQ